MAGEKQARLPFEGSIIVALATVNDACLPALARLIIGTEIHEGHEEILAAWEMRWKASRWGTEGPTNDFDVPADLAERKQKAADEAANRAKRVWSVETEPSE
jgi:hypothetical protein